MDVRNKITSNNYDYVLIYSAFGFFILGLFTVLVASSDIHWIVPVIVQLIICYPIAEFAFFAATRVEIYPEKIAFCSPWRKYSFLKKRPDFCCVVRADEWDTLIYSKRKESSSFFFLKDNKAVYLFSVSGLSVFDLQLRSMYFPDKTFIEHQGFTSIHLIPELFEHFPEKII